jgi:hypothetical protein
MPSIPLQRSKAKLEEEGWKVWKVETWNQWSGRRIDLYNLMDLVAIRPDVNGVLGIQCCSEDIQLHIRKYLEGYTDNRGTFHGPNEFLPIWKAAGNKILIHSWVKRGERGKRKTWQLREVIL